MSYILIIEVLKDLHIKVGKLGLREFLPGLYVYVGSAKKNFTSRIRRHLRKNDKKLFWHIDYLLKDESVRIKDVYATEKKGESILAEELLAFDYIRGFGSSDAENESHLFFIDRKESLNSFMRKNNFKKEAIDNYI
jgi:Uri superfamily endonuclease